MPTLATVQTFMAGYAPAPVFAAMSGIAVIGASLCAMRNTGKLPDQGSSQAVWQTWLDVLGVAGVGLLVQVRSIVACERCLNVPAVDWLTLSIACAGCHHHLWRPDCDSWAADVKRDSVSACAGTSLVEGSEGTVRLASQPCGWLALCTVTVAYCVMHRSP